MYSGILVKKDNKTLALNGGVYDDTFQTFFQEYLFYKRGYQSEFDNIYESIKEPTQRKGWPFLNEQAVLVPKLLSSSNMIMESEVEQRWEIIEIYFATPTFDKITRDVRTNFVSKLSMIGGMLGLFTGFSVMSGIEILYFAIRMFLKIHQN